MKKFISLFLACALCISFTGCTNNGNTGIESISDNSQNNHQESNHSQMSFYSQKEYEKIKGNDTIAGHYSLDVPDNWNFYFFSNSDFCIQSHVYIYNDYNNIMVERIESILSDTEIEDYFNNIKNSYGTENNIREETDLAPKINSFNYEKDKENNYILKMNVSSFEPYQNEGDKASSDVTQVSVLEVEATIVMKVVRDKNSSYILTYSGVGDGSYYEKVGADKIIESFKIIN